MRGFDTNQSKIVVAKDGDNRVVPESTRRSKDISVCVTPSGEIALMLVLAPLGQVFWDLGFYPAIQGYSLAIRKSHQGDLQQLARDFDPFNESGWSRGFWQATFNSFGLVDWKDQGDFEAYGFWVSGRLTTIAAKNQDVEGIVEHLRFQLTQDRLPASVSWPDVTDSIVDDPVGTYRAPSVQKPVFQGSEAELVEWQSQIAALDCDLSDLDFPYLHTLLKGGVNLGLSPDYDISPNADVMEKVVVARAKFLARYGPRQQVVRELSNLRDGLYFFSASVASQVREILFGEVDFDVADWCPRVYPGANRVGTKFLR